MRIDNIPKTRHICPKCGKKTAYKERKGGGFEGNFYWNTRCLSCGYNQEKAAKNDGCMTMIFILIIIMYLIQK